MKLKKLSCLLLAAALLCSFTGCQNTPESSSSEDSVQTAQKKEKTEMDLLYCFSDSFNPYTATTAINRNLCTLLYDPLIKRNNNFEPVYSLAQNAVLDGTTCTVTLKNALFSDGSAVTASDVVHSYNLAKASATIYAAQLYEVSSVSAANSQTVVFRLTRHDPYILNLLDFPIIKAGTESRTDQDSVVLPPVGSGRYVVSEPRTELLRNDRYHGEKGSIATIHLINAPDPESVSHYVEIGATDIYFTDIGDGNIVRMSGKKTDINLNHMVYIGMNDAYGQLSNPYLRYALSSALDRSAICQSAYYNNAIAATGFFNPAFKAVAAVQNLQNKPNLEITIENLKQIGYNSKDGNPYRVNASGRPLSFTLLVNSENQSRMNAARLIADQLKAAGIEIKVITRSYADYIAALQSGNFQLYLGEVRLLANMDLSPLVLKGGSAAYGIGAAPPQAETAPSTSTADTDESAAGEPAQKPATAADIINGFYSGINTITDVANALQTEMPVIPVCYRKGLLFYDEAIENVNEASLSDIYFSIESYTIKK